MFIGSHLDTDIEKNTCRLAFHGTVADSTDTIEEMHERLRIFRKKTREGVIDRALDKRTSIIRGLFKKEANSSLYIGLTVTFPEIEGLTGRIDSPFGKSGKYKIVFNHEIEGPIQQLTGKKVQLEFKKFLFHKTSGSCERDFQCDLIQSSDIPMWCSW